MRLFVLLALVFSPPVSISQSPPADLVVVNAKVRTMTSKDSAAEAFAVSGSRITAVGTTKLIRTFVGPSTRVVDAGGRLVIPGFNDAHVHFMAIGNSFSSIDLRYVTSPADMTKRLAWSARFLPKGRWILGGNFKNEGWELPDRRSIDAAAPDNPVFLYSADSNIAVANTRAFEIAKLGNDVDGVNRDASGEPTGVVRDDALKRIRAVRPSNHTSNWMEIAETATNYAASLGVTTVQDMQSDDSRQIYLQLQREGKLKTRVYDCLSLPDWKKLQHSRMTASWTAMVTDGCLKGFSEGDEEPKPALLREVVAADKVGLQIMIHAIGRSANKIVLDMFEQAAKTNGARDRRFRIEHAHNTIEEDVGRFKRSNIIASMQPFLFVGSSGSRYRELLKLNAVVAFGSDASIVDLNPLFGIHAAVASAEPVSVYEAVRAYTVTSAYAEFREKEKGSIEPGKLADFVILSDDVFAIDPEKIRDVKIVQTVVDGKVVYQAN